MRRGGEGREGRGHTLACFGFVVVVVVSALRTARIVHPKPDPNDRSCAAQTVSWISSLHLLRHSSLQIQLMPRLTQCLLDLSFLIHKKEKK